MYREELCIRCLHLYLPNSAAYTISGEVVMLLYIVSCVLASHEKVGAGLGDETMRRRCVLRTGIGESHGACCYLNSTMHSSFVIES